MSDKLYLDVIPKIRVYEKKLIDSVALNRVIDLDKLEDVFKFLSETSYGENLKEDINIYNYEMALSIEFKKLFSELKNIFDDNRILDIFLKKYKYNNVKLMIKSKILNVSLDDVLFNIDGFDNDLIYKCIKNENYSLLPDEICKLIKKVFKGFEESNDPQKIDILIDNFMFNELLNISEDINNDFLKKYVKVLIDVFNIKTLFRIKKLNLGRKLFDDVVVLGGNVSLSNLKNIFSDSNENILNRFSVINIYKYIKEGLEHYISTNELSVLDKELDNYLMEYFKNAKIITTGLAPIIGYVNAKENEIKNIRIILVGKINDVDSDSIRGRLRKSYV